jgi:hypothetical protein
MDNPRVMKYLQANFSENLEEFGKFVEQTSIESLTIFLQRKARFAEM